MKVVITGATGFIGRALCEELKSDYEIVALTRNAENAKQLLNSSINTVQWDAENAGQWSNIFEGTFCIANLAGENIGVERWTEKKKERIINSRIKVTTAVVEAIRQAENKPKVLIQASAMGWYGSKGIIEADEDSGPGEGFLAKVSQEWERTAEQVNDMNVRLVKIRLGMVLGQQGGVLPKLIRPFRFFAGGYIGSGRQWVPWVSINDVVGAVRFLIKNDKCSGAFNITGPQPVTLKEFCRIAGQVTSRPSWTVMPAFAAKLIFGEMAEELLLASYKIRPKRLTDAGYEFRHRTAQEALKDIIKRW